MQAWERRLKDLAQLLNSCHSTYFEPDLFRRNVNQFLQTSRTVTFIIQKNKELIPGFEEWYPRCVRQPWSIDPIMEWARDSRNVIEKEGDLELNSSFALTVLFSYLEENDQVYEWTKFEFLHAGAKALGRAARRKLPTGVADAAVVKIERRWVVSSLPNKELLAALTYVYGRLYDCCLDLAGVLGKVLDVSIPSPQTFISIRDEARRVMYLKLSDMQTYSVGTVLTRINRNMQMPAEVQQVLMTPRSQRDVQSGNTMEREFDLLRKMAAATFRSYGNHIPILFVYDESWDLTDMIPTNFADQADKYIFWRFVADRVSTLRAHAVGWISESWVRDRSKFDDTVAIRNMPIVGEVLNLLMIDKTGRRLHQTWDIKKRADGIPALDETDDDMFGNGIPFHLIPVARAMGLPDPADLHAVEFTTPRGLRA